MPNTQQSPKQILEQCLQSCEQSKQQLVQQIEKIPNPQSRTAAQMAVNAIDACIAQCHTAAGGLQ